MADGRIIKGQADAQQKNDLEFVPNVGVRTILRRDFFNYDQAVSYAAALFNGSTRASVRQKGDAPIWTVESSYEGDPNDPNGDLQNTHELRANVLNPDWKTNAYTQSLFALGVVPMIWIEAQSAQIKDALQGGDSSVTRSEVVAKINDPSYTEETGIQSGEEASAILVLDELLLGADTFIDFQYVYTHTFNFGTQRDAIPDHYGVREIFTPAQVQSFENIPPLLGIEDVGGEWLKLPPEVVDLYGGRRTLKYEYWWATSWSRTKYATAF